MMGTAAINTDNLWLHSPAVRRADWLATGTQFEELNELHAQHQELLAEGAEKLAAIRELEGRYAAEDEGVGKRTPLSKRTDALEEARHEASQARERLKQFISDAIATVQEHEGEWREVLLSQEAEGRQRVAAARAAYEQAKAEAEQAPDLRVWIERTSLAEPARLLHWGWFLTKPSGEMLTIANQGFEHNPPSAALREERLVADGGAGSGGVVDEQVPDFTDDVADWDEKAIANLPAEVQAAYRKRMAEGTEKYDRDVQRALEDHEASLQGDQHGDYESTDDTHERRESEN